MSLYLGPFVLYHFSPRKKDQTPVKKCSGIEEDEELKKLTKME